MSLAERRDARHLSGFAIGREPVNPYRSVDRGEEMGKARAYASEFGKMVELQLPRIIQGLIEPDDRQRALLESAYVEIWEEFSPLQRETHESYELGKVCVRLAEPNGDWFELNEPKEPKNEALKTLLQTLDEVYETDLINFYEKICKDGKLPRDYDKDISPYVRYLVQTALFLAREVLNPTPLPLPEEGVWIPNLYVQGEKGKPLTQIDAVLTTSAVGEKLTKPPALEEILKAVERTKDGSWEMIEIRLLLRARYNTGPDRNKLRKPLRRSLRGIQERLGILALWWQRKEEKTFPFPNTCKLIYVRSPSLRFYNLRLDSAFFEEWVDGLREKHQAFYDQIEAFKERGGLSTEGLAEVIDLGRKRADAEKELTQALEELGMTEKELIESETWWEEGPHRDAFEISGHKELLEQKLNNLLEGRGVSREEIPTIVVVAEKEAETSQLIEILEKAQKTAEKREKKQAREGRQRLQALRKMRRETGEEVVFKGFKRLRVVEKEPTRPKTPRKKREGVSQDNLWKEEATDAKETP